MTNNHVCGLREPVCASLVSSEIVAFLNSPTAAIALFVILIAVFIVFAWYDNRRRRLMIEAVKYPAVIEMYDECYDELLPTLPNDMVLHEILPRLGDADRARLSRVSKSWMRAWFEGPARVTIDDSYYNRASLRTQLRYVQHSRSLTYLRLDLQHMRDGLWEAILSRLRDFPRPIAVTAMEAQIPQVLARLPNLPVLATSSYDYDYNPAAPDTRHVQPIALDIAYGTYWMVNRFSNVRALRVDEYSRSGLSMKRRLLEHLEELWLTNANVHFEGPVHALRTLCITADCVLWPWHPDDTPVLRDVYVIGEKAYRWKPSLKAALERRGCRFHPFSKTTPPPLKHFRWRWAQKLTVECAQRKK